MTSAPPLARIAVGVVVERRKAQSPWIDFTWRPISVLAGRPDASPWTLLSQDNDGATFYAGAAEIELHRTETGNYGALMSDGAFNQTFITGAEYIKWVENEEARHRELMKEAGFIAKTNYARAIPPAGSHPPDARSSGAIHD